jgi:mono/diheme cytochrome c family protein
MGQEDVMTRRRTTTMMTMSLSVAVSVAIAAAAPSGGREPLAARQTPMVDGSSVYKVYCASCHGEYGRGNGAVAVFLRLRPADLTRIAKRNKGTFPADRVYRLIDGRQVVKAHGDSQMPVWGDAFSIAGADEASIKAKIEALVRHLKSIQEP